MFALLKSVGKHFAIYGLGSIANYMVGFLLLPLYTHYLTPSDYGTLELVELTVYIAGMFMGAGIANAVLRFYYDSKDPDVQNKVVSTALLTAVMASAVLGTVLIIGAPVLSGIIYGGGEFAPLLQLAIVSLAMAVISQVPLSIIRAREQSVLFVTFSLTQLLVNVAFNLWFVAHLHWGVRGIIWGGMLSKSLGTAFLLAYMLPRTGVRLSLSTAKSMFAYGAPLILGSLSIYVLNFSDRFLLKRVGTLTDVGLYALGYKFGMLISPLVTEPFLTSWRPKMFEIAREPDAPHIYSRMFTYFLLLETFVVVAISVLIKDVITIMTDAAYHEAYKIVPVILLAYVFSGACNPLQIGILMAKRTRYIAWLTTVAAAANVVGNLLLIPKLGMWGAAITTLGSFALLFFLTDYYSRRFLPIAFEYRRIGTLALAALVVVGSAFLLDALHWGYAVIPIKFMLIALFPLLLFPLGFYGPDEMAKIKEWAQLARRWMRTRQASA